MKFNASFLLQVTGRPLIALHPASSQFIFKDGVSKSKMSYAQRKCMHATFKHIFKEACEASNGNGLRIQMPDSRPEAAALVLQLRLQRASVCALRCNLG